MLTRIDPKVLSDLVETIKNGRCVAFVGAGFSADTETPTWRAMVGELIDQLESDGHITSVRASTARDYASKGDYDGAASVAIDRLEIENSDTRIREIVQHILTPTRPSDRDTWLAGIPFASVLTTNYDGRPGGKNRDHDAYREILRGVAGTDAWLTNGLTCPHRDAVALHGQFRPSDGPPLVLTRRQYRDLLYRDPGYRTFLRSLFATTTILFLGKSFGDEYLNEMRAEVLSLVGDGRVEEPLAYAAVSAAEFTGIQEDHLRDTEGIQLLRYGASDTETDFEGFDALLEKLYDSTNFFRIMQRELAGLQILWLDTNAGDHWGSEDVDGTITRIESGSHDLTFDRVSSLDEAMSLAGRGSYDFIISNWGFSSRSDPTAIRLLDWLHDARRRVPIIVFASPTFENVNRADALRAGAFAFEVSHENLFRRIHELASSLKSGGES